VHHILKAGAMRAYLAGNVGTPLISEVERWMADRWRLAGIEQLSAGADEKFRPNIGALLI